MQNATKVQLADYQTNKVFQRTIDSGFNELLFSKNTFLVLKYGSIILGKYWR